MPNFEKSVSTVFAGVFVGLCVAFTAIEKYKNAIKRLDADLIERATIPDTLPRPFWRDVQTGDE